MSFRRLITPFAVAACVLSLTACASRGDTSQDRGLLGGVFGGGGGQVSDAPEAGIGVNSFLWRSSLEVLSFMPLSEVDPFGGVIITEWYSPPESSSERFKINIYILDKSLRADGLRVTVFRQKRSDDERWVEAQVNHKTSTDLENAILKRARQMRIKLGQ